MGKISPVSAKYIVHTQIQVDGVVDKPDVVGAIFGQTEGLLGADLELRELQRSGRIGRIEVNLETRSGRTSGAIIIPSSLDKAETAIISASLETIQRIGPCNAKVKVEKIEDVRISKRSYVIERAKELLKELTGSVLPDSQEITDEVAQSVRMMEIREYGKDRLSAGPAIDESEEIIVVEGRADVLNLLKQGIKNAIAIDGTMIPDTVKELSRRKVITAFVDGDRGGDLILKELLDTCEIDYAVKAPDGKEVEEITKKEIHKALRSRVAIEQVKMDLHIPAENHKEDIEVRKIKPVISKRLTNLTKEQISSLKQMLEDLVGTRGAYILDQNLSILGKVPTTELTTTIKEVSNAYAIVFDGIINQEATALAEKSNIKCLVAMSSKVNPRESKIELLTRSDLQP